MVHEILCDLSLQGGKEVIEQVVGYKKKPLEEAAAKLAK